MQVGDLAGKVGSRADAEICQNITQLGKSTSQKTVKREQKALACFEMPRLGRNLRSLRGITDREKDAIKERKFNLYQFPENLNPQIQELQGGDYLPDTKPS